jgi:ubiquinone biosynthesis protein Coq4
MELQKLSKGEKLLRMARTAYSMLVLMRDPGSLNAVLTIGDSVFTPSLLKAMLEEIGHEPQCRTALAERYRLGRLDVESLNRKAPGTLGHAFIGFLQRNQLNAYDIPMRPVKDAVTYARAHLLETHDIWHTVTDFEGDVAGELGLHGFYLAQMPTRLAPLMMGGGIIQTLKHPYKEGDARMRAIVRGWLMGKRARPLFGVKWNDYWDMPLAQVRAQFRVDPAAVDRMMAQGDVSFA